MATQLAKQARRPTAAKPDPGDPSRSTGELDRLLNRVTRLSAALLRVPTARAYLVTPEGVALRASFPPPATGSRDDARARVTAREVMRTGSPAVLPSRSDTVETDSLAPAGGSHLGVPLPGPTGQLVGTLVVSDGPSREWRDSDLENLTDLAAISMAGMRVVVSREAVVRMTPLPARGGAQDVTPAAHASPVRGDASTANPAPSELFSEATDATLVEIIRESIVGSLHLGALHAGDRLPSIRQTARAFSVTPYLVLQAYAELEVEGLVERRERSGVFVANFEVSTGASLPETGAWLTEVLTQACQHQVKIPLLPDLIRRWTTATRVRCACVESCLDSRFALGLELSQQFGIEPIAVSAEISAQELRDADLVITTAYHAAEIGPLVAEARKPLLIATVSPLILSSALNHLRDKDLTVICVDPVYGERLRTLQGGAYRQRVRVITVGDIAALQSLDRSEAVLLTPAARQHLKQPDFRLVAPMYPSYSLDFARKVAEALVRINLQGARA